MQGYRIWARVDHESRGYVASVTAVPDSADRAKVNILVEICDSHERARFVMHQLVEKLISSIVADDGWVIGTEFYVESRLPDKEAAP